MKDNRFGIEDFVGILTVAVIVAAAIWIIVAASGGWGDSESNYTSTGTHCEEHEGYAGQVVVTCERD